MPNLRTDRSDVFQSTDPKPDLGLNPKPNLLAERGDDAKRFGAVLPDHKL